MIKHKFYKRKLNKRDKKALKEFCNSIGIKLIFSKNIEGSEAFVEEKKDYLKNIIMIAFYQTMNILNI
tara:strand:- start:2481 stop:2684 length:204 start_codon:yes stop_codon:yes gene_type:complete